MEFIDNILAQENTAFMVLLAIGVLIIWFLPAMLALIPISIRKWSVQSVFWQTSSRRIDDRMVIPL